MHRQPAGEDRDRHFEKLLDSKESTILDGDSATEIETLHFCVLCFPVMWPFHEFLSGQYLQKIDICLLFKNRLGSLVL